MKQIDIHLFDQRVVRRNVEQGLISKEDYEKYLKSLPDGASEVTEVHCDTLFEEESNLPPLTSLSQPE